MLHEVDNGVLTELRRRQCVLMNLNIDESTWDEIRTNREKLKIKRNRAKIRVNELAEAKIYAERHSHYSKVRDCESCDEDVSIDDFNLATDGDAWNNVMLQQKTEIIQAEAQLYNMQTIYSKMTRSDWDAMDLGGRTTVYSRHTNFSMEPIQQHFKQ